MASRVYQYGTLPRRIAPPRGEEAADQQLRLAHRLWNTLVAIDRTRTERYRRIMRDQAQERIDELKTIIEALRSEIKMRRKGARKRAVDVSDLTPPLEAARAERRILIEQQKATKEARHEAKRDELTALNEITKHRIVRARQAARSMGLFWGTYNDVVGRADTGRKVGELQFRRWSPDGTLTAQIMGGAPVARCSDGGHGFFQIPEERVGEKGRWARMRIGSTPDRAPVWLEIPIVPHRPIPDGAVIKSVSMTRRDGRWSLNVTATVPEPEPKPVGEAIAVDIGWRLLEGGVRVGYWQDTRGAHGEILVAAADIGQLTRVDSLRSICDRSRDEYLPVLAEWIKLQTLDEEWKAKAAALALWRSTDRLAALIRWWADHRLAGDEELFAAAIEWRKQYLHLANWWRNLGEQMRLRVREQYRVFAARVARDYQMVILEEFDLRSVAEIPATEEKRGNPSSSGYRQKVSPSVLRHALRNACLREGLRMVEAAAEYTTRACHACGALREWNQEQDVVHRCEVCGALWDQDRNAAINLLRIGLASADSAPTENQPVRQRKWDRIRDRSQKGTEKPEEKAIAV
jgi:Putative transposase DNA-binding domain